jgi:hypothetical protein
MLCMLFRAGMFQCEIYQAGWLFFLAGAMPGRLPFWAAQGRELRLRLLLGCCLSCYQAGCSASMLRRDSTSRETSRLPHNRFLTGSISGPQSYSQVRNFAAQEKAKSAMNHMRWGLASQVTERPPYPPGSPPDRSLGGGGRSRPCDPSTPAGAKELIA